MHYANCMCILKLKPLSKSLIAFNGNCNFTRCYVILLKFNNIPEEEPYILHEWVNNKTSVETSQK